MRAIAIGLVLAVIVAVGLPTSVATADEACSDNQVVCPVTHGDQGAGAVVTEGTQFPNTDPDSPLGRAIAGAKGCRDCQWAISPACLVTGPDDSGLCAGALTGCADPQDLRFRVYLRRGDGPWILQGTVCLGPDERPTSVADVGAVVRERVVNYLPDAHPAFQPRAGGIVNLPTIFSAGERGTLRTPPFDVLGFTVVVTAAAHWMWTFDEGATRRFDSPGGAYPDTDVAWTYDGPGRRQVSVTTYWRARFTVDGAGPFAVPGPDLTKTAGPMSVPVRSARSEIVVGRPGG